MAQKMLRLGSEGSDVQRWQNFLIGQGHLRSVADADFGPLTAHATKAFQRSQGLTADALVGPATLGKALTAGFDLGFTDDVEPATNPVLVGTSTLKAALRAARERMFGRFDFAHAPTASNRERIVPDKTWETANIKTVTLSQLKGVPVFGTPSSGRVRFHRHAEQQLKAMWAAWEQAGLLPLVLSYEGSYNPRFIRGSRSELSNHAFGSAFDINQRWNGLGMIPALEGAQGSLRELVPIANEHGFFWGGHFKRRPDGMHFEVAKLI